MNLALLVRVKAFSGNLSDELVSQVRIPVRKAKFFSQVEIAFYLSSNDPNEYYILAFCYLMQDLREAQSLIEASLNRFLPGRGQLVEELLFQLNWEYRLVHLFPAASHLRLLTIPEDYPFLRQQEFINGARHHIREWPGSIGAWFGRCISGRPLILSRADWSSPAAQLEYVGAQVLRQARLRRRGNGEGVEVEYASFELQSLIKTEPGQILLNYEVGHQPGEENRN